MKLNGAQREKVVKNMGLVGKVIKDKVHGINQMVIYTYEDLTQIGYIGLCKAVYTEKGGCFSTYAYKIIWHEICDALIKANYQSSKETFFDVLPRQPVYTEMDDSLEVQAALQIAEQRATPTMQKGIQALIYASNGYSSRDISQKLNASDSKVRMWMTRARRFLVSQPELITITAG